MALKSVKVSWNEALDPKGTTHYVVSVDSVEAGQVPVGTSEMVVNNVDEFAVVVYGVKAVNPAGESLEATTSFQITGPPDPVGGLTITPL